MLKIGIIGAGRIGRVHAESIRALREAGLVAVADADAELARSFANNFECAPLTVDNLLEDRTVEAVVIATPTSTHAGLIERAARAGKAILCEKPIDLDVERAAACAEIVREANVPCMVGFNRRFDPNFSSLKSRVKQGQVGDVQLITIISRDGSPPPLSYAKSSGGLYRDMMIHDFDMARFLLDEEPSEVFARGSVLVCPELADLNDVDTAVVILRTRSGKIGQLSCSRQASYGRDQRVEVHGSAGMIRADNVLRTSLELVNESGFAKDPVPNPLLERFGQAFREEMRAFVTGVRTGSPLHPSIDDGLAALRLADAATLSSQSGRLVELGRVYGAPAEPPRQGDPE